jgi:two-component system, LytTR family, response regulator
MTSNLRVIIVDDERPARALLARLLAQCDDVTVVGEVCNGEEGVAAMLELRPDLALLDLQMPGMNGLEAVRAVPHSRRPLVAFITAHDEHAVRAFELNAIDYLLKPVDPVRLRHTLTRAHDRLDRADIRAEENTRIDAVVPNDRKRASEGTLRRIPVRRRDDTILLPVDQVSAVVADGELLWLHTSNGERHCITFRLKDLEARLGDQFMRLSRGTIARIDHIQRVSPMPGGTFMVILRNGMQLQASRMRARALRDELLRL